ncbi:MAG TPA: AsmA-like C-terminal region-containing protein [Chthoniobacterales bacterium]|nr:AsmA-like C-terminal region-containing protein [Chthoniobacterales bacterium]
MPSLLEPTPPSLARQFYRRRSKSHRSGARALRFLLVAIIFILAWSGWYLAKRGFGRQWRDRVVAELHKRGVEASVRRLTLDPVRGLIAQDVRIFDFKNRENTLAVISEVALDINYAALLHRQPFLNALDIRGAELTIPTPQAGAKPQITQFRAHIYFPPEQIYVSQAEGMFCGVRISATGQLIKRSDYKPSGEITDEEWRQRMTTIQRVADELRRFSFPGEAPSLQVKFSGDLSQFETARAEATLRGDRVQRGPYEMRNLAVAAEWTNQTLNINLCEWSDNAGNFSGRASWSRETKTADFQARSTLDAKQFLGAFGVGQLLTDLAISSPPVIELSGSANFAEMTPRVSVIGSAVLESFTYKTVPFLKVSGDFSWNGERGMLRGLRLRHDSGELTLDLLEAPDDFRLSLESDIDPTVLRGVVSPEAGRFLGEWEWRKPPVVRLAFRGPSRAPATWTGDGTVALQRTRFRGAWMNNANANLRLDQGALTFDDFRVTRDEGVGTGSFTYDFVKREVHLKDIKSTLRPADAILWIEPKLFKAVAPYKFRQPPSVVANGVVHFGAPNDHLELTVDAPAGMDYVFLGKTLPVDRVSGRLLFTDNRLQLGDIQGALFGGAIRGTADISLAKGDPRYQANLAVDGLDFPRVAALYFNHETARGRLSGRYDWTGLGSDARSMQGKGSARVTDGDIFAIPIFGPLSGLLSAVIPGAGYSLAHKANASFAAEEGVIHTDDFKVSGKLFGMVGRGDIRFLDDKLDFDIRIDASGPGVLLTPVYKLFEYKGEGSISKPTWRPKNF